MQYCIVKSHSKRCQSADDAAVKIFSNEISIMGWERIANLGWSLSYQPTVPTLMKFLNHFNVIHVAVMNISKNFTFIGKSKVMIKTILASVETRNSVESGYCDCSAINGTEIFETTTVRPVQVPKNDNYNNTKLLNCKLLSTRRCQLKLDLAIFYNLVSQKTNEQTCHNRCFHYSDDFTSAKWIFWQSKIDAFVRRKWQQFVH